MKTLLIMTVGQSDVQLVLKEQRHKFEGNTCGTLHDAIKERTWLVVNPPKGRSRDFLKSFQIDGEEETKAPLILGIEGKPSTAWVGDRTEASQRSVRRLKHCRDVEVLSDGDLELCTPKLDAVLDKIGAELPTSVLLLETRRGFKSDPRFAGEVMKRRLDDRGIKNVTRVAFLTGEERLEDPSNDRDAVVRRTVVATLSKAIRDATEVLTPDDRVFVATTGGLDAANELVTELARLFCVGGPQVTVLNVPDSNQDHLADQAVEEKFHPATGCRARWHALSLIEKGNLLGAWGAVSHLEGAPGQEWTRDVKWLYNFASSLPNRGCEISVLSHQRMAVRAALRVELALRAGDIPRAVHGTVAFFEAALWDHLLDRFDYRNERRGSAAVVYLKSGVTEPTGKKLLRNEEPDDKEKRNCPFEHLENGTYLFFEDGAGRFARDYLQSQPLKALHDAIVKVKALRNDVAHNEPTPQLMAEACGKMVDAQLWSDTNRFLTQPLVKDVLVELGLPNPVQLCDELLSTVRARILRSVG